MIVSLYYVVGDFAIEKLIDSQEGDEFGVRSQIFCEFFILFDLKMVGSS